MYVYVCSILRESPNKGKLVFGQTYIHVCTCVSFVIVNEEMRQETMTLTNGISGFTFYERHTKCLL